MPEEGQWRGHLRRPLGDCRHEPSGDKPNPCVDLLTARIAGFSRVQDTIPQPSVEVVHNFYIDQIGIESNKGTADETRPGWPLVAMAAMFWALDLALRPMAQKAGLTSVQIVLFEHLVLAALFVPSLIRHRSQWQKLSLTAWLGLGFIAIFGSAFATLLITEAYRMGSPLVTALLQKTQPIFTVILAGLTLSERRKPSFWPLFGLALVATYLLGFGFSPVSGSPTTVPVLMALGAAAIWGTCTVVGRVALREMNPSVVAGWRFMIALPFLLALAVRDGSQSIGSHLSLASLGPVILIVVFPDALGMLLYYTGLKRTPASLATIAELAFPATALLLSLANRTQSLDIGQWIGLGILLVSLHLIQASRSVQAPEPA
jgi:drug/metabolite transporter (DMT)-like permease